MFIDATSQGRASRVGKVGSTIENSSQKKKKKMWYTAILRMIANETAQRNTVGKIDQLHILSKKKKRKRKKTNGWSRFLLADIVCGNVSYTMTTA